MEPNALCVACGEIAGEACKRCNAPFCAAHSPSPGSRCPRCEARFEELLLVARSERAIRRTRRYEVAARIIATPFAYLAHCWWIGHLLASLGINGVAVLLFAAVLGVPATKLGMRLVFSKVRREQVIEMRKRRGLGWLATSWRRRKFLREASPRPRTPVLLFAHNVERTAAGNAAPDGDPNRHVKEHGARQ
jgi:hypothetical protein